MRMKAKVKFELKGSNCLSSCDRGSERVMGSFITHSEPHQRIGKEMGNACLHGCHVGSLS